MATHISTGIFQMRRVNLLRHQASFRRNTDFYLRNEPLEILLSLLSTISHTEKSTLRFKLTFKH